MKYILLISCFFGLGYLSHGDQIELIDQMKSTCYQAYMSFSEPLESRCARLIDRIQQNEGLEVITDYQGNYWVEEKD